MILVDCNLKDISPLKNLPLLRNFVINGCFVTEFSVFQHTPELTHLDINQELQSITEIGEHPYMIELSINSSILKNLQGVEHMDALEILNLHCPFVRDFSPLNDLPRLHTLRITNVMKPYLGTLDNDQVEVIIDG